MRVTVNTNFDTVRDSIDTVRNRMQNLQNQEATLKKVNRPSEDPVGSVKVLEMRTDKMNNEQFLSNLKMAELYLGNTDHILGEMSDIVVRAKEIAIGQSNAASNNKDSRVAIAEEVNHLYQAAVAAANSRIGERHLFGGYKVERPPVNEKGQYLGDEHEIMVEVAKGIFVPSNLPGIEAFNTNPENSNDYYRLLEKRGQTEDLSQEEFQANKGENVNLFQELQNLRIMLLTGDISGVQNTLERFDSMHNRLVSMRSKVGSRMSGLKATETSLERANITNAKLTSSIEDADMMQVVSDLAKEETIFRSSLKTSQHLIQPTLLDFLK